MHEPFWLFLLHVASHSLLAATGADQEMSARPS